jgi:hypothetical protein
MPSVSLSDIESVSRSDLSESRLSTLENGYDRFDAVLNSSSGPIALDNSSRPYRIIDKGLFVCKCSFCLTDCLTNNFN